jgi:methanogenic corrinoid protein MtbC1
MPALQPNPDLPVSAAAARQRIEQLFSSIATTAADQVAALMPRNYLTPADKSALREQIEQHLTALMAALISPDSQHFMRYLQSLDTESAGFDALRLAIEMLCQVIRRQAGDAVCVQVKPVFDPALAWLLTPAQPGVSRARSTPANNVQAFTASILNGNRLEAEQLVFDVLAQGHNIRDVYLTIIQPSLYEVGRLWETGQISIPQEHLATAITQSVLAAIYAQVKFPSSLDQHAVIACLQSNYHEIGPRMLADFLQMAGYNTRFLGTNTSIDCLIEMIQTLKPGVIGLPATIQSQVDTVKSAIERVHADFTSYRPTIMVGGLAFNHVDGLWKTVKADLWGEDGGQAVDQLVGSSSWV